MAASSGAIPQKNQKRADRRKEMTSEGVSRGYSEKPLSGNIDYPFLIILMTLLALGILMMFSASYAWAIQEGLEGTYYAKKQIAMAAVGIIGMLIVAHIDYHILRKPIIVFGLFGVASLLMLMCRIGPFKDPHHYSYRWVKFGPLPSFQPSEIMKFAVIVLFAYLISINYSKLKYAKYGILPFMMCLGFVIGLMAIQPHISGTIIICAIGVVMMFVGGTNIKHLMILGIIGVVGLVLLVLLLSAKFGFTYFEDRMISWRDPFNENAPAETWQTKNSLIAIGSGGLFGLGFGNSRQKFLYLPEAKNDFVFAVVCEELGFIGAIVVIVLFLLFIGRGFFIASRAYDKFGMMLATGLTVQIGIQALLNIAVVTNTIPNTGVSLPFFSYGGTAHIMQLLQMGVILSVSRYTSSDE